MRRASIVLLAFLFSASAASADVTWIGSLEDAIAGARNAKSPILLHLRGDCGRCNNALDRMLESAENHEAIVHAYSSFVLCRLPAADDTQLTLLGNEKLRRPSLMILSPGGMLLTIVDSDDLNEYMALLNRTRIQLPRIRQIDELRASVGEAEADMLAARIALAMGEFERARVVFDRAGFAFAARDDEARAERARIERDYAACLGTSIPGMRRTHQAHLAAVANNTKYPLNAAEAYVRLGFLERDRDAAADNFRKAFDRAERGSEAWTLAAQWLVSHGKLVLNRETPAPTISIVKPARATLTGRVELTADCGPAVSRVAWFQDGAAVASVTTPPFAAKFDLGKVPRVHTIQARAYDRSGSALGQAETVINDRIDAFRVTIVTPAESSVAGKVEVEAEAHAPAGAKLRDVELLWNEQSVAKLETPPYRATFDVPKEFGFIRAVATLDDGRTAEETKPVNERVFSMPVNVHEIVFPVTVVNRGGPIAGLEADDFVVKDEGRTVPVTFMQDEGSTIGLAIDASTSMSRSLLDVIEMTQEIITSAVTPKDKAFLMAFDDRPFMIQMTTADAELLRNAAMDLTPLGMTSLYDAVAFGLQQFIGLPGRRALVVITDAIDVHSDQSGDSCAQMAREIGVPVYIIVTHPDLGSMSTPVAAMNQRSLRSIAEETGGGIFFAPRRADQLRIFSRIRDEVRGQYLLTFAAPEAKAGSWRKIKVEVPKVRASVRTIVGYYAR